MMTGAIQTLNALDEGRVMNTLQQALHEAGAAVKDHGKPATVTLKITIAPARSGGNVVEQPVYITAEISSKLPSDPPPPTLFFLDEDGNPTRNPTQRQPDLAGLSLIPTKTGSGNHE